MAFTPIHTSAGDVHHRMGPVPSIPRCAVNGCDALVYGSLNCNAHLNPAHYQMNNAISQLHRTMSQPATVTKGHFEGREVRIPETNFEKRFEPSRMDISCQPSGQPPLFQGHERQYATMASTAPHNISSPPSNSYWCPTHQQRFSAEEFAKHTFQYHQIHDSSIPRHVEMYGNPPHTNHLPYSNPTLPPMRTVPPPAEVPTTQPAGGVYNGFPPQLPGRPVHHNQNGVAHANMTKSPIYGKDAGQRRQQSKQPTKRRPEAVMSPSTQQTSASAPRQSPSLQKNRPKPTVPPIINKAIIVVDLTDESSPPPGAAPQTVSQTVPRTHRPASHFKDSMLEGTVVPAPESLPFYQKRQMVTSELDGKPNPAPQPAIGLQNNSELEVAPERQPRAPEPKQGPTPVQQPVNAVLQEQSISRPDPVTSINSNSEIRTADGPEDGVKETPSHNIVKEVATRQITPQRKLTEDTPRRKAKTVPFDSAAFDALIYQQEGAASPPKGLSLPKIRKPPIAPPLDERQPYLHINPMIHRPHKRSQQWSDCKAKEIHARSKRKKWFGKATDRQRWLWAQKEPKYTDGEDRVARQDPQPRSYSRPLDYGDVPAGSLPQDVLQNPAWAQACAWHRDTRQMEYLRRRERHRQEKQTRQFLRSVLSAPSTR